MDEQIVTELLFRYDRIIKLRAVRSEDDLPLMNFNELVYNTTGVSSLTWYVKDLIVGFQLK